jgi:hypothetical protein
MKTGNTVLEGLEDGIKYLGNHIISIFTTWFWFHCFHNVQQLNNGTNSHQVCQFRAEISHQTTKFPRRFYLECIVVRFRENHVFADGSSHNQVRQFPSSVYYTVP